MEIARMWKFNFKLNSFKKLNLFFATYVIDCVCDDMLMLPMICCVFWFFCCILFSFLDRFMFGIFFFRSNKKELQFSFRTKRSVKCAKILSASLYL